MKNVDKYVGIDVHAASCTLAVRDEQGRLIAESRIKTEAATIRDAIAGLSGRLSVTFEEGTHAAWLYDLLRPIVSELIVCNPRENRSGASRTKSDRVDAARLSEWLYKGALKPVFHGDTSLRALGELVRAYEALVADRARAINRLKALFRSQAISVRGRSVYTPSARQAWLAKLGDGGARARASILMRQIEAITPLVDEARKAVIAEERKQKAARLLETIPGLGPIRVAQLMAAIKTPHRFRTKRQLWAYAGLSVVTRSSSEVEFVGAAMRQRAKAVATRGLNRNCNRRLKEVFKGAATSASTRGALVERYRARLERGMKPQLAKVSLARSIASLVLGLWKKGERFDERKLKHETV